MTTASINARLRRVEARHGFTFTGDIATASDAQLLGLVRSGYGALRSEHGDLRTAARRLRETGQDGDAALATLIEEDIGDART